jgi:hypothetical protein
MRTNSRSHLHAISLHWERFLCTKPTRGTFREQVGQSIKRANDQNTNKWERDGKEMPMTALLLLTVFSILKKVSAANPCEGSNFYRSGFLFYRSSTGSLTLGT